MALETIIQPLNPDTFEYQTYSNSDEQLIVQSELDTVFSASTDYIEYYIYDQNKNLVYPEATTPLLDYNVRDGDVLLDPSSNLEEFGFDIGVYNILYNFYRKRGSSSITSKYFISQISSDRTEIRLDSNTIENNDIISSINDFISYREEQSYFVDFYLNFGDNQTIISNNIKLETEEGIDPTVLIKLYEPLPSGFNIKDELWIVELLSVSQAYEVDFPFEAIIDEDFTYIAGPNYSLNITGQTAKPSEQFSYNTLLNSDLTSSISQIKSLLDEKQININIDYEKYKNFVNFSSATTRLENFFYKTELIQGYTDQINSLSVSITSDTADTFAFSSSKANLVGQVDTIIKNFDGYEYFLYFNSGSDWSYPKSNTEPPFNLYPTDNTEVQSWITSSAASSSAYDVENKDWLYYSIPEYLREDPENKNYELFVDMVGQYYDNVWTYTKDITNKFDADNRLDYGISKDLVADAIQDFAIKLYSNNFNTDDLFTAFLGITPSGSSFPFPYMTGSIGGAVATPSGFEYVNTEISASNDIVPLDDVNKRLYKRIYHNIPYLLKTKGTVAGLRALITSYGIPDTILRVSEFGGKDRNESQDYDLKQNVFNYAFSPKSQGTGAGVEIGDWRSNSLFPSGGISPKSVQVRFKPTPIPLPINNVANSNIRYSQSIWQADGGAHLVLEYSGNGLISGSFSGSIPDPYDTYGTLKFIPSADATNFASVYLPFFNGDWWSAQINLVDTTGSLYSANEIDGKIGFNESSSANSFDPAQWEDSRKVYLNRDVPTTIGGDIYESFSGSFQEYRFWAQEISQSNFYDYTVNPYSDEGNGINTTPNQLYFRAALGTQLDTGSRTSIHPRVTGSAIQITQSFASNSNFVIQGENWITNVEDIFQDQAPVGIKNRITDKIKSEKLILAEAPYGFQTPTSSVPFISSKDNYTQTISAMESMQQYSYVSQSYTPNVNYLEVAFSPSNQINDDINAQLGYFNLGEFIGDPRFASSSLYTYPNLDSLRDQYFEKYINSYDIVDFIRLIKFFDNSLFKMIKDFTPARTSLASGVVVKQHLLERNRQRTALVTSSLHDYEGLVVNLPKNYSSGSTDFPQYSTSGSALYKFSGGPGGSFNRFNGLQTYISGSDGTGPDNRFGITQSWQDGNDSSILNSTNFNQSSSQFISGSYLGPRQFPKDNQSEFYDGIFSGSVIPVHVSPLNKGCTPYLDVVDTPLLYYPIFFSLNPGGTGGETTTSLGEFLNQENSPPSGYAWIGSLEGTTIGVDQVVAVKISQNDINGVEVINYLDDLTSLRFLFEDAAIPYDISAVEYVVTGRTIFSNHALLNISTATGIAGNNYSQTVGGVDYFPITSSDQGGSMNWSLEALTDFNTLGLVDTESNDNSQQGVLSNPNITNQEQNVFYWSSTINDALGFFGNPGVAETDTNAILNPNGVLYSQSAYTAPYTSNIPWVISASVVYSSSLNTAAASVTEDQGVYHSGSSYSGANLVNQNFTLGFNTGTTGFTYYDTTAYNSAAAASSATLPTVTSDKFYYTPTGGGYQLGTSVYEDSGLNTQINDLVPNKFYLISNLIEDFGVQRYWVGQWQLSNTWAITSEVVPLSPVRRALANGGVESAPTTFIPSPKTVLDLGDIAFNGNNWNTQILGNSGSSVSMVSPYAGHPKIKLAGTASFDWEFPSLTLAGISPTLGNTAAFVPFTGSQASLGFSSNDDFNASFNYGSAWVNSPDPIFEFLEFGGTASTPAMGFQRDGSVLFRLANAVTTIEIDLGGTVVSSVNELVLNLRFTISSVAATAANDYAIRMVLQQWNGSTLSNTQYPMGAMGVFCDQNGTVNIQNLSPIIPRNVTPGVGVLDTEYRIAFEIKNNTGTNLDYSFQLQGIDLGLTYNNNVTWNVASGYRGSLLSGVYSYQGTGNPAPSQTSGVAGADFYPQGVVDVYLKRTGSGIPSEGLIITSSTFDTGGGYSGSIYSGSTLPITNGASGFSNIYNDTPWDGTNATSGSTVNNIGDIYYIEYSASRFRTGQINGISNIIQNFAFEDDSDKSRLYIAQTASSGGGSAVFNSTGSIRLRQANKSNIGGGQVNNLLPIGNEVLSLNFNLNPTATSERVSLTGSFNGEFNHDDIFRFSIANSKVGIGSGLFITEFTASIFPSQSIMSEIKEPFEYGNYRIPTASGLIVPTFYPGALPFNLALDCQPTLNNYSLGRFNPYLQDVDYNNESGPIIPINQALILQDKAVRAQTPVSNYTQLSSINLKYNGVKTTSAKINVWSIGDTGTFGQLPTVELRDAFFGYFNDISDPYPNINDLTRVNLNYLIDEQGNALPPSLKDQLSIDTFESVFPDTTLGSLAVKFGTQNLTPLSTPAPISRIMQNVTPICYSQISGNNYSNTIPLSGSGYISRYDNDDSNTVTFGTFAAAGTSSVENGGQDQQTVDYYINPSEANKSKTGANSAYTGSGAQNSTGSASYPTGVTHWGTAGDDLDNSQVVSIQHSVVTSYVSETKGVRDELDLTFLMFTGSNAGSQAPFNLEGIDCKVYTDSGQVYLLKDVDDYGWFTYANLPTSTYVKKRKKGLSFKRYYYSRVPIPGGGIKCKVDWEMFETLFDLGLMRSRKPKNGQGVVALEWIFKANSGNHVIKAGEKISWKVEGSFKNARNNYVQGVFFPNAYNGLYTPAMINGAGALDYKLEEANQAVAPFWIFSGSTGASANTFIEMESSNFNEAYGTGFYQGDLPYIPGFSEYFPGNVEPKTTSFDPIEHTLQFEEGDEIRFGNNESYTYIIKEVFAPSENVSASAAGNFAKVKLRLDKPVDTSINKDFFLVRRTEANAQSLYLDSVFPYGILSSASISTVIKSTGSANPFALNSTSSLGSFPSVDGEGLYTASVSDVEAFTTPGILYPDFPTEYLLDNASTIVNDLISKGIIEA